MSDMTPQAAALLKRARELLEPEPEQIDAVRGALARKLEAGAAPSCGELEAFGRPGLAPRGLWGLGGKLGLAAGLTLLAGAGVFVVLWAVPHAAVPSAAAPGPGTAADAPAVSVVERAAPSTAQPPAAAPEPPAAIAGRPARTRSSARAARRAPSAAPHLAANSGSDQNAEATARPAATPPERQLTVPAAEEGARVAPEQPRSAARATEEVRDRVPAPPERDLLVREVAMLEGARTALERGNAARALQILDAHEREFPAGALSEEQLALRARALCAIGRIDEGRRAVQRLAARAPDSPHLKRSQAACGIEG